MVEDVVVVVPAAVAALAVAVTTESMTTPSKPISMTTEWAVTKMSALVPQSSSLDGFARHPKQRVGAPSIFHLLLSKQRGDDSRKKSREKYKNRAEISRWMYRVR
jgi:hypothetical protein